MLRFADFRSCFSRWRRSTACEGAHMVDGGFRCVALRGVVALLLTSLIGIVWMTGAAPPAHAACTAFGSWTIDAYNSNGTVLVARESPQYSGTCDNDNYYAGQVLDPVTDGSCAYVWFADSGYYAVQGYSCTTGGWGYFSFSDTNGDRSCYEDLGTSYIKQTGYHSTNY